MCQEERRERERDRERRMDPAKEVEEGEDHEIVIVGGGICGLATALALHRKGLRSVVYERSESLRAEGSAIGIFSNGWRALDQLGVGDELRDKAILIQGGQDIWFDQGNQQPQIPFPSGEARCIKRGDLVNALANALPPETIRFGSKVVSVKVKPESVFPSLQLYDGNPIQAKVVIGCDGSNSILADFLGLKSTRLFALCAVRGLTTYPMGHVFPPEFVRMRRGRVLAGRIPIDNKTVYWFVTIPLSWLDTLVKLSLHNSCTAHYEVMDGMKVERLSIDSWSPNFAADRRFPDDPALIKKLTLETINGFPADALDLIEGSDLDSLSITHLRYRAPWEILLGRLHKGLITVAGDAMHVMGPFLGQGGSAALEDAVVLARNLGQKIGPPQHEQGKQIVTHKVGEAFSKYVEERRMRVVQLSTQTYLTGLILGNTSSLMKFFATVIMAILFRDRNGHTKYDCGKL